MASNPGEWYAERAAEAERLGHELAGARAALEAVQSIIRRLERALEQARYVGD